MKVLQTLGRHKPKDQEGIFQYRRTPEGVEIDGSVGLAETLDPKCIIISHDDWQLILDAIWAGAKTIELSEDGVLDMLRRAVPSPGGTSWNDCWRAYVLAILEHEGTIDIYGGARGRGVGAPIVLARDDR